MGYKDIKKDEDKREEYCADRAALWFILAVLGFGLALYIYLYPIGLLVKLMLPALAVGFVSSLLCIYWFAKYIEDSPDTRPPFGL